MQRDPGASRDSSFKMRDTTFGDIGFVAARRDGQSDQGQGAEGREERLKKRTIHCTPRWTHLENGLAEERYGGWGGIVPCSWWNSRIERNGARARLSSTLADAIGLSGVAVAGFRKPALQKPILEAEGW